MRKPRLLDLFCGAGGCSVGYHRAGFDVVGCDIKPQPRYPFPFVRADAMRPPFDLRTFDAIHASPPCQKYTQVNRLAHLKGREYADLLGPTREMLIESGLPWIIENVQAAPMTNSIRLCGSSFGLLVRRHRLFEGSFVLFGIPCSHRWQDKAGARFPTAFRSEKYLTADGRQQKRLSTVVQVYGHTAGKAVWPEAMGIDWMTSKELTQAIPPAYTEFIGRQLMAVLE